MVTVVNPLLEKHFGAKHSRRAIFPAIVRLRQEDQEFKVILDYM